ncbi:MAG: hypothetical protein CM15mP84_04870 [Cellvibrionales bacterium]|nr:MAG: hypothetical protein CM15mP84_04870 [Cellvibrionales bacterium]
MQNIPSARARLTSTVNALSSAGWALIALLFSLTGLPLTASAQDPEMEEVVVTGTLNSLPGENVDSIFGFNKSIVETPRSASTISEEMMDRFNMSDIDELVVVTPGSFTQSFFGVAGALDVRGPRARHTLGNAAVGQSRQLPHAYWRVGSGRHCEGPSFSNLWAGENRRVFKL